MVNLYNFLIYSIDDLLVEERDIRHESDYSKEK